MTTMTETKIDQVTHVVATKTKVCKIFIFVDGFLFLIYFHSRLDMSIVECGAGINVVIM